MSRAGFKMHLGYSEKALTGYYSEQTTINFAIQRYTLILLLRGVFIFP